MQATQRIWRGGRSKSTANVGQERCHLPQGILSNTKKDIVYVMILFEGT